VNASLAYQRPGSITETYDALLLVAPGMPPAVGCPCDFNQVDGVTVQDIFDFLSAWSALSPSADFNQVDGVTVQDIFDFLSCWSNATSGGC
jgi:hypothetical protein